MAKSETRMFILQSSGEGGTKKISNQQEKDLVGMMGDYDNPLRSLRPLR
jgi:hypothetical protein